MKWRKLEERWKCVVGRKGEEAGKKEYEREGLTGQGWPRVGVGDREGQDREGDVV